MGILLHGGIFIMLNYNFRGLAFALALVMSVMMMAHVAAQMGGLAEMDAVSQGLNTLNAQNPQGGEVPPPPPPPITEEDATTLPPVVDDMMNDNGDEDEPGATDEETQKVVSGKRVYGVLFPSLMLDDARVIEVPISQVDGNYYDDGTHGDEVAGDGLYTNIEISRGEFLSPKANDLRRRSLSALIYNESIKPLDFFMVPIVSVGYTPDSEVEETEGEDWYAKAMEKIRSGKVSAMDLERIRDRRIMEWAEKWLAQYRRDVPGIDDPRELPFYPVYIPQPPEIPNFPPPANFNPSVAPGAPPPAQVGGGMGAGMMGSEYGGGAMGGGGMGMGGRAGRGSRGGY